MLKFDDWRVENLEPEWVNFNRLRDSCNEYSATFDEYLIASYTWYSWENEDDNIK